MKPILSLVLANLFAISVPFVAVAANLQVEIKDLRHSKGQIKVGLYQKDGFPDSGAKFKNTIIKSIKNKIEAVFQDVPEGTHAVAIIHDENMDSRLWKNTLGIPNEGYGFSNGARGSFGPTPFENASFSVGSENKKISERVIH